MKIKASSQNVIIFLFTIIYFYCNLISENLFPRRPEIYIVTKIIPLIFISIYILFIGKFYYNSIFKLSLSFYVLFFVTASISGLPLAVLSVRLLPHMPSNSSILPSLSILVCSIISPDSAL